LLCFHGSDEIIEHPTIIKGKYTRDFGDGFYCSLTEKQAVRVATRYGKPGILNIYEFNNDFGINIKKFDGMTEEWLDFIVACRKGKKHNYDIVEGPSVDDLIFNHLNDYISEKKTRETFWDLVKFSKVTNEISFNTEKALTRLDFRRWNKV
jgi:hypothetical protein